MAIVSSGCSSALSRLDKPTGALINTNPPASIKSDGVTGICLPISSRASLNIDVEGIFDYVQSTTMLTSVTDSDEALCPWVRCQISF